MSWSANNVALSAARRWPRQLWLLAGPLAVVWFGFWGLLWNPETYTPPRSLPRFIPHARFLPGRTTSADSEAQHDLRVMWSPILFALPTPMGFSRAPAAGAGHARPRVQRPTLDPVLRPPPHDIPQGSIISAISLPVFAAGDQFSTDTGAPVFTVQPVGANTLEVELRGDLATLQPLEKPMPIVPAALAVDSWDVNAYVDIGREGSVRHVFLDPPSASPEFNAYLLQALYRWQFAPAPMERRGTISFHYTAAQPPASASEVAQP